MSATKPLGAEARARRRLALPTNWMLGAIVLVGAAVRFPTIGTQSFWYDEAVTRGIVFHGLGHVISTVPATESTPPLYYVLLWVWSRVFGTSEAGLRSFSALAGLLVLPVMWELGRRLISERVGQAAALLAAVSPLLFWYSQEARAYSLLTLLSALSLLAMLRAIEHPERGRLLVWGLCCALALCTHYFAVFVVVPEALWLIFRLRRSREVTITRLASGLAPIVIMAVALAPLLIHQNDGRASVLATSGGSVPYRLASLARQDIVAFGQPAKAAVNALAGVFVVAALALLAFRARLEGRRAALWPLAIGLGGVILALVVSLASTNYFETRNLLPTWPALALVIALGCAAEGVGRLGSATLAGLALVSVACVIGVIRDPVLQRPDWRGVSQALGAPAAAQVIIGDRLSRESLTPYMPALGRYPGSGAAVSRVEVIDPVATDESLPKTTSLSGFQLVRTLQTSSYTLRTYASSTPQRPSVAALLAIGPKAPRDRAMVQRARAPHP
ncbi:MAG: glycosyltransferase family 39 protein [Solirubrobacteraceae bacterium]